MSDMFLELRSRIPVVAAQTHIGTARLQEAQKTVGLSNESVARKIPVSEKTWRRWKEAGEVPTSSLPAVAKALRLELRELDPTAVDEDVTERLDRLEAQVGDVQTILTALAEAAGIDVNALLPRAEVAGRAA